MKKKPPKRQGGRSGQHWKVPRAWPGETVFIVASGPSRLTQGIERLEGRRVIAINTSGYDVPFADYLVSIDGRWLNLHRERLVKEWADRVVTVSRAADWPGLKRLRRLTPPNKGRSQGVCASGISTDPEIVVCRRTGLQAAMNVAVLFGSPRLVLLGADGQAGPDGVTHAHPPHPWKSRAGCWGEQAKDLATCVAPLRKLGVEVVNASPGSNWKFWPRTTLDAVLAAENA